MRTNKFVESALGVKTSEALARRIDDLLPTLPEDLRRIGRKSSTEVPPVVGGRTVTGYVSTRAVDRDGEIVLPEGIELDEYRLNPVVLFGHNVDAPAGKCLWIKADEVGLVAKSQFPIRPKSYTGTEWLPDFVYSMIEADVLRGFSIGFLPLEAREPTEDELAQPGGDRLRRVITRALLVEFSIVSVPSNPLSLIDQIGKGWGWEHWGIKVIGKVKPKQSPKPKPEVKKLPPADPFKGWSMNPEDIADEVVKRLSKRWEI